MRSSEQTDKLDAALALAWGELRNPVKNRTVQVKSDRGSYSFQYATLDSIYDMVRPVLVKHNIVLTHGAEYAGEKFVVSTRLSHVGQWVEAVIPVDMSGRGMQAMGSGITYAKRYGLSLVLPMTADEDDDGNAADGNHVSAVNGKATGPSNTRATPAKPPKAKSAPRDLLIGAIREWSGLPAEDLPQAMKDVAARFKLSTKSSDDEINKVLEWVATSRAASRDFFECIQEAA